MLKIEKTVTMSSKQYQIVIDGMRNPMNSWDRSDSYEDNIECTPIGSLSPIYIDIFRICENDYKLMMNLAKNGSTHAKYRRMMPVWVTLTAPLYFYKEFDVYKVGTVANSCSTMHKIQDKEFTIEDFSCEHLIYNEDIHDEKENADITLSDSECYTYYAPHDILTEWIIPSLNNCRRKYLETKDKKYWWQMIQLLPSSYNQKRTVMLNYEVLANMYHSRKNHRLDEWKEFCRWIETLPYAEVICGEKFLETTV